MPTCFFIPLLLYLSGTIPWFTFLYYQAFWLLINNAAMNILVYKLVFFHYFLKESPRNGVTGSKWCILQPLLHFTKLLPRRPQQLLFPAAIYEGGSLLGGTSKAGYQSSSCLTRRLRDHFPQNIVLHSFI